MKKQKIINKKRLLVLLQRQNRAGCSDKKLLWRANLFVNNGDNDWNNRHTWEFDNEWNHNYNVGIPLRPDPEDRYIAKDVGSDGYSESFGTLSQGEGDQVVNFNPTVWHGEDFGGENPDVYIANTAVYCWGATTSPFEYNERLFDLRDDIASFWTTKLTEWQNENTGNSAEGEELDPPRYWEILATWNETTPPYLSFDAKAEDETPEVSGIGPWVNYIGYDLLPAARNGASIYHDEAKTYLCYNTWPFTSTKGIGIDCGGLVYMSAAYDNCPYGSFIQVAIRRYLDVGELNNNLWMIARSEDSYKINVNGKEETTYKNLNLVRPGDIFYYYKGSYPNSYHVAIIQDINYPEDGRDLMPSDIEIIEATGFKEFGGVRNTATLANLVVPSAENDPLKSWRIGRIKIGE